VGIRHILALGLWPQQQANAVRKNVPEYLGLGLLIGIIGIIIRDVSISTLVGVELIEVTAPMFMLVYAGLAGTFFGALIGALVKTFPSLSGKAGLPNRSAVK